MLLLTMNRPNALNAMTPVMEADINALLNWFEEEPSLWSVFTQFRVFLFVYRFDWNRASWGWYCRVCIVTGAGRAFCAGADLIA